VLNSYVVDPSAQQLLQELVVSSPNIDGYSLQDGLITFKGKLWVGYNSATETKIIQALHSSPIGGHLGIQATVKKVHKLFRWPGIRSSIESFIKQCQVCQQAKHENYKYPGLLSPIPVPQGAWQDISLDFIEGLPLAGVYSVILVVVDRFTKYAYFYPFKHLYTASSVAATFLNNMIKLHGLPKSIVSDHDKVFLQAISGLNSSSYSTLSCR
jgi:hypothetical protein